MSLLSDEITKKDKTDNKTEQDNKTLTHMQASLTKRFLCILSIRS